MVRLGYVESSLDYRSAAVQQSQVGTASAREIALQLPAAVPQNLAQARVDVALAESWGQRATAEFSLPPRLLALEPGDVISVDGKAYRLSRIMDAEARVIEAVQHDASVYDVPALVERMALPKLADVFGPADVVVMDLALSSTAQPAAAWIAAQAKPWPGRLSVLKQQGGAAYVFNAVVGAQATMGEISSVLPSGIVGRVDYGVGLDVALDFGALSSVTRAEMLAGANVAAIGTVATGFEILQFESAVLTGVNSYRLSGLLRAQAGSLAEMLPSRAAGERFVLLNGAVSQIAGTLSEALVPQRLKVGPASLDAGSPAYVTVDVLPTLKGLRPLQPSMLRVVRSAGGVVISWIRQTRNGGDGWDLAEVPLGEDAESYALSILNGGVVVRSFVAGGPQQFYSDAQMIADFGAVASTLSLRVVQVSAAVGPGTILERVVNVGFS